MGMLKNFWYEGESFPLSPTTAFYNWIYINALIEDPDLSAELTQYEGFTGIEFNPDKSLNCQASAAALYVALARKGLLDQCQNFEDFVTLI